MEQNSQHKRLRQYQNNYRLIKLAYVKKRVVSGIFILVCFLMLIFAGRVIVNVSTATGNADAQFRLGAMYDDGFLVRADDVVAVSWYRRAAEQGHAEAQNELGRMYAWGLGVPEDDTVAVSWYRKAAEQGNVDAQHNLGTVYANGAGIKRNWIDAYMWLSLAVAGGNREAGNLQERISRKMASTAIARARQLSHECKAKNYKECGL